MSDHLSPKLLKAVRLIPQAVKVTSLNGQQADLRPAEKVNGEKDEEEATLRKTIEQLRRENAALKTELDGEKKKLEAERRDMTLKISQEAEKLKEKALREGYEEGYRRGAEQGKIEAIEAVREENIKKISSLVGLLESVHEELKKSLDVLLIANEAKLVRLWEKILSRLLFQGVSLDEGVVLRVLREILARASDKERILVYLNPSDLTYAESHSDELAELLRGVKHLEFIPDDNVDRGSCVVETNLGVYDARWRTQLEQISQELDKVLLEGRAFNGS
ncbi:FliH/SctL family protein [Acetomicrobium sp. S15 = DSM 107314]|uniref:FliH/SctL family protein n=1 Tax=Acetomicrobium sp. S15 = DSM 107314 TaxID=2529858 RepID=UPI0018E1A0FD|nr:FliH/SctL family protein [Acetomicrobium sp. S15 = DSM 107314]